MVLIRLVEYPSMTFRIDVKIEGELARQEKEMLADHVRRMSIIKEELEGDIRGQLRRQAAAHSDHLQDMLGVQVGVQ